MPILNYLVEGEIDEAVAQKLIVASGHSVGDGYGKRGAGYIKEKIANFNLSAVDICYFALVDFMDTKCKCPGDVVATWLPHRRRSMIFRIVVPEIESWLLADRSNLSKFLNVPLRMIPERPEEENNPKRSLVSIAQRSGTKKTRDSMVPLHGSPSAGGTFVQL